MNELATPPLTDADRAAIERFVEQAWSEYGLAENTATAREEDLLPIFRDKVKLIISELKESDAAVLGASALVWELK